MSNTYSPLVSIITPTYNHEAFISQCIESVLAQTYSNWEQIIIDDGSTDKTADIARRYDDPRIRYFHQDNAGIEALAHTYNRALDLSRGELVAILEGDDCWPAEKLSSLVPAFLDDKVILAYGAVADIAASGRWRGRLGRSVRKRMGLSKDVLCNDPIGSATGYMLRADGVDLVPPSTVVIRRAALDTIDGFQYSPGLCVTDFPTVVKLSMVGKFCYSPEVMGYRRRHSGSATFNNLEQISFHAHHFVNHILDAGSLSVSVEERLEIENTWRRSKAQLAFTAGRVSLARGEWSAARAYFLRALRPSSPRLLLAAGTGWCVSWLRCDLERIFALIGFAHLESEG
jgi:glycosyltransferase involved in cell wall biosynthesis